MATILIVEDDNLIRLALSDELVDDGHEVVECSNVLEALAFLGRGIIIDAVVTDVDMPGGLSGLDLAEYLQATKPATPVWVTSGRMVDISFLGDQGTFLSKPYDFAALAHDIADHTEAAICSTAVPDPARQRSSLG